MSQRLTFSEKEAEKLFKETHIKNYLKCIRLINDAKPKMEWEHLSLNDLKQINALLMMHTTLNEAVMNGRYHPTYDDISRAEKVSAIKLVSNLKYARIKFELDQKHISAESYFQVMQLNQVETKNLEALLGNESIRMLLANEKISLIALVRLPDHAKKTLCNPRIINMILPSTHAETMLGNHQPVMTLEQAIALSTKDRKKITSDAFFNQLFVERSITLEQALSMNAKMSEEKIKQYSAAAKVTPKAEPLVLPKRNLPPELAFNPIVIPKLAFDPSAMPQVSFDRIVMPTKLVMVAHQLESSPASYNNLIGSKATITAGIRELFRDYAHPGFLTFHWNRHHQTQANLIATTLSDNPQDALETLTGMYSELHDKGNVNMTGSMIRRLSHAILTLRNELYPAEEKQPTQTVTPIL
jgi:hypothetical protein